LLLTILVICFIRRWSFRQPFHQSHDGKMSQ
jgi:hypothetical protein